MPGYLFEIGTYCDYSLGVFNFDIFSIFSSIENETVNANKNKDITILSIFIIGLIIKIRIIIPISLKSIISKLPFL